MKEINVYCDESCHLLGDHQRVMVLGAVTCPRERTREVAARLREIKALHGLSATFEIKWSKISMAKAAFYEAIVDYFFDDDDLTFRALVVPDKSALQHEAFGQTHDDFYYKMYFDMLKVLLDPASRYDIYLDIKDTRSSAKTQHLREVLANNAYDFHRQIVRRIELVRSEHVQQVQLADLLIGAVGYLHRGLSGNEGKLAVLRRIQKRSGYSLLRSTLLRERKTNVFVWRAREAGPRA